MRKKLLFFAVMLVASMFFMPIALAQETPELIYMTDVQTNRTSPMFFAKGVAITIEERTDEEAGATISWDGGSQNVPANTNVFGANHNSTTRYETTSITMNGGEIRNIFGGGLHKSNVGTANVTVNGGKVFAVQGGGASSFIRDTEAPTYYAGVATDSPTRVEVANVIVNGGTLSSLNSSWNIVYGGGEGISYTGSSNVKVTGGTWDYVIAGGSNGYTGESNLTVAGGVITTVQSVNRGSMNSADITITGGRITNAYVGGDASDSTVTGTINEANMNITGGEITNVAVGTNGGQSHSAKDVVTLVYNEEAVENIDRSTFNQGSITETISLTISCMGVTETIQVPKGSILTDAEIEELKNIDLAALGITGYTFGGYYQDAEFTTLYDFTTAFNQNTTIYMKLDEIPTVEENPDTKDNIIIISILTVIGLSGTVFFSKKKLANR